MVHALSPGAAHADHHIVLAEHGATTLTVHLRVTEKASACRASSVDSHAESSEKTHSRKKKCEKRKKKKSQHRHSSSDSMSGQKGRCIERSANPEVVSKSRAPHDLAEQMEAYGSEAHSLSPDRPLESDACELVSPVHHSVQFPWKLTSKVM